MALVRDVCASLSKQFRAVALVNIDQEPANLDALKRAAEEAKKAGASVCLTDFAEEALGGPAGRGVQRRRPRRQLRDLADARLRERSVREKERISVAPMDGLAGALKKGAKSFAEAGGEDAYFGDPTAASVEEGEAHFTTLADILTLSIMEHLGSKA